MRAKDYPRSRSNQSTRQGGDPSPLIDGPTGHVTNPLDKLAKEQKSKKRPSPSDKTIKQNKTKGKPWGQSAKARDNPAGSGRMKPGEVAFFFSLYEKNRWPW